MSRLTLLMLFPGLLVSCPTQGAEPSCVRAVDVDEGEVVPCTGTLMARSKAVEAAKAMVGLTRCRGDLERCQEDAHILDTGSRERLASKQTLLDQCNSQLDKCALLEPPPRSWQESPYLWGPVGVISGGVLATIVWWVRSL